MPIPAHELSGVLPPFQGLSTVLAYRSPYDADMEEFVRRFATSLHRINILKGILDYRTELMAIGLHGFQWLCGSFVELLSGREPNDIDVVTFFERPLGEPAVQDAALFDLQKRSKSQFLCDGYFVELSAADPYGLVLMTHYWYGLFSHRRDRTWKGLVCALLDPADDDGAAKGALTAIEATMKVTP